MTDEAIHLSRRAMLAMGGAAMLWPNAGGADALETISGTAFGTTWRLAGPAGSGIARIRPDVVELFEEIDRQMSPWRRDSAISRFNAGPAGSHASNGELVLVTEAALALAGESRGAFDPTVGPLVARWGFGPIEGGARPDWRGLSVEGGRIAKTRDTLTLDLCGIAKGRALDLAAEIARAAGVEGLLLDLGGELRALGRHPSGRSWRVAVESPRTGRPPPAVLRLPAGQGVATSGLRAQSYTLGGRTYGHIIDPGAREPADGALRSVTVVATDAMTADGWATALFAAGGAAGPALARARGLAALFLFEAEGLAIRQVRTGAIEELLT